MIDRRAEAGEVAYEAYRAHTGGVSLATGQTIPKWEQLPASIQQAWIASSLALIQWAADLV